jgi:hypothetical protein
MGDARAMPPRRLLLIAMVAAASAFLRAEAGAEILPDPAANHIYTIRDNSGRVVELLVPKRDHFDIFASERGTELLGHTRRLGDRLLLYDRQNRLVASIRPELLPPESEISAIAVVRDTLGNQIGLLSRY